MAVCAAYAAFEGLVWSADFDVVRGFRICRLPSRCRVDAARDGRPVGLRRAVATSGPGRTMAWAGALLRRGADPRQPRQERCPPTTLRASKATARDRRRPGARASSSRVTSVFCRWREGAAARRTSGLRAGARAPLTELAPLGPPAAGRISRYDGGLRLGLAWRSSRLGAARSRRARPAAHCWSERVAATWATRRPGSDAARLSAWPGSARARIATHVERRPSGTLHDGRHRARRGGDRPVLVLRDGCSRSDRIEREVRELRTA